MSISFETAKKLKEAGLKWKPKTGDWGYNAYRGLFIIHYPQYAIQSSYIYAPRLDQMLKEIDKAGRLWHLYVSDLDLPPYCLEIEKRYESEYFTAESPEEATAQALLWILEQEDRT